MAITLEWELSVAEQKKIIRSIFDQIKRRFKAFFNTSPAISKLRDVVAKLLRQTEEFKQLAYNQSPSGLASQLGLPANQALHIMETIVDSVVDGLNISFTNSGNSYSVVLSFVNSNLNHLLNLPEASHDIPWLSWFLTEGDKILVTGHKIVIDYGNTGKFKKWSRSGHSLMTKLKRGGSWRVPPEYAGTINHNWITRTLEDNYDEIGRSLEDIIEELLR